MRWRLFKRLLRWYANEELDQWGAWVLESKHGPVYVRIERKPIPTKQASLEAPFWDPL